MKRATVNELRNSLRRFLDYVKSGGMVRVFDRGVPVADISPCRASATESAANRQLAALERDGLIRPAERTLPDDFTTRRLPKADASVLRALLDERSTR
jgi:antitoxin (DNA-binding transcriptional repressor) of toxin-antitoxin stability system